MDEIQLNKEIVLCRSLVKRAKVCVIRKLTKKIKILRSCKNEQLRKKKLGKARRLTAEIHTMKTLRPDYVTKFALITEEYVPTGSNTKLKRKRNACAKLAKHKDLIKKINDIRNKFSNWKEELPLLLQSKSKKNKSEDKDTNMEIDETGDEVYADASVPNKEFEQLEGERINSVLKEPENKTKVKLDKNENLKKSRDKLPRLEVPELNVLRESNVSGKVKKKRKKKHGSMVDSSEEIEEGERKKVNDQRFKEKEDSKTEEENVDVREEEKIDDPFFIGKKIIAPVLMQKDDEEQMENGNEMRKVRDEVERELKASFPAKKVQRPAEKAANRIKQRLSEDDLHPSWKAKKMQTLRPFEGKKIVFE